MSPETKGNLLLHTEEQRAVMFLVNLQPSHRGEVYQMWLWQPGTGDVTPVGTFRPLNGGYVIWAFSPPSQLTAARVHLYFGVTREPEGGSAAPTSPMLATAELSSE